MCNIEVKIDDSVKHHFPGHGVAAWGISAKELGCVAARAAALQETYLHSDEAKARVTAEIDRWKGVFKAMGAKSGQRSSLAALANSVCNRGFRDWGPIVNFYNGLSLISATPLGAYDARKIEGSIRLSTGLSTLRFTPIGKSGKPEAPRPTEVYYRDDRRILCRMWNLGDCEETKVTDATRDVFLLADLVGDSSRMSATADQISEEVGMTFRIVCDFRATW
jgi:DNA/RNA-binding domain of Phe-tRNA-synthetase-like protein